MGNLTLSASAYKNPIGFIKTYAPGTVERMALARAQDEAQVCWPSLRTAVLWLTYLVLAAHHRHCRRLHGCRRIVCRSLH